MSMLVPRYSPEEHARLGSEMYERDVRARVEAEHRGRIVAIDVDSGDFELDDEGLPAAKRLLARRPAAQLWCVRIGYPAVHRFGLRATAVQG
jgi:hypothetical protein